MKKNSVNLSVGILMISLLLSGCSAGKDTQDLSIENENMENEERRIIGVVSKSNTSEYWMSVNSGMEAAAAENNIKIVFLAPDSELDKEVQEKQVEKLVEQEVDALAVSPIDSYYVPSYMDEIRQKNIPVVTFDTGFENQELPYIGIDNYKTGYELGKELAKQLNHTGQVGVVAGDLNQMGHRERMEGFRDYIETEPQMSLSFVESGYANLQMSEQKVRTLMEEYPEVKGILATSAVTALGLAEEMKNTGIKIAAVDEQEDSLNALEKGELAVLAAQSGYDIGYQTIEYIRQMCCGEKTEQKNYLDAEILTSENLEEYRRAHENQKYKE